MKLKKLIEVLTQFQNQINEINTLREELNEIKDILRNITNGQNS